MITLSIILIILYLISIYKAYEVEFDVLEMNGVFGSVFIIGTALLVIFLAILIVNYLP
jgi:hypothetical protein